MNPNNPIYCKECNGSSFDNAHGAWWCEDCGLESIEHGPDLVYDDTCPQFVEPDVGEDSTDYLECIDYPDEESSDESTDDESSDESTDDESSDESTDDESTDDESLAEKNDENSTD